MKNIFYISLLAALLGTALPARAQLAVAPLESTLDRTIEAPLERRVPPLDEELDEALDERVRGAAEEGQEALEPQAEAVAGESGEAPLDAAAGAAQSAVEQATGAAQSAVEQATGAAGQAAGTVDDALAAAGRALRPLAVDVDPFGRPIEKNVLIVLLDASQLATLRGTGIEVIDERDMTALGLTLVTLRGANSHTLAQQALQLRQALPGATVDFNHIYRFAAAGAQAPAAGGGPADAERAGTDTLTLGMIDSAVDPEHPALADSRIVARDFVVHQGTRPRGHGTGIASLLAGAAGGPAGIYAASVFVQLPQKLPGASTESLVTALDWLAAEEVDVINMSLAGPGNALLERAVAALAGTGPTIVAAVGNNGPSGEPLYPAAYDGVIGATAVDRERRVFRYANRGAHVDFAAPGVNVKVANAGGGWRIESGTSIAAPRIAVVVATAIAAGAGAPGQQALIDVLVTSAEDLGRQGFDDIFGHGLLAQPPTILSHIRTPQPD